MKKPEPDIQFGIDWAAAAAQSGVRHIPELNRRMHCARWANGTESVYEHRKAIIQTIWPEHHYSFNAWSERRLKGVCEHNFVTMMAGGGSGKTTDFAVFALEWWLEAPHESAVVVCSTTKDMLRTRIWGQIVHYLKLIPKSMIPPQIELLDTACFIRWEDGDWKNGIKGVAVQDGPVEEAINNIIGMHTRRVLWVLDEMQGVREAIVEAIPNLLTNPESRFWGMGNPDRFTSLLCRYSEPIGGWDTIVKFQPEWETESHGYPGKGLCMFFDGRKSPAILDPEWGRRSPWMINQQWIDDLLYSKEVNGNENHPKFMTQRIGWPPSTGVEDTVLDASIINTFRCQQPVTWTDGWTSFGALDPAFNGGDKAVLQFGRRGFVHHPEEGDRWVIWFEEPLVVPKDGERKDRTPEYLMMDYCKAQAEKRNIKPEEFAIASAGAGAPLIAIFKQEWGPVEGIQEGGSASERVLELGRTARQSYDNRSSELQFGIREMAMANGIRGLSDEAVDQLCKRLTFYRNGKWCVEPKRGSKGQVDVNGRARRGFKERLGYSPDHADSVAIGVEHCRNRGAEPGSVQTAARVNADWNKAAQEEQGRYDESNYVEEQDWQQYA